MKFLSKTKQKNQEPCAVPYDNVRRVRVQSSVCLSHTVSFSPPICFLSSKELYQPSAESLRQQEELKLLYQRQQEKGGIIDLEAERNRYFISLQQVRKGEGFPFSLKRLL
jgi:hypothetical protein